MLTTMSLNGMWDFVADLDPKYHAQHSGFHRPDADRRHWLRVPVPCVWQQVSERYDIFEGVCWFAREFDLLPGAENASARLRFGAVSHLANVYLNGEWVGRHEGAYTEFVLDVTGKLKQGRNQIAVQVDNRATSIQWPPCLGYFNYGGIHRDVALELLDGAALDDVAVRAAPAGDGGTLAVSGTVREPETGLSVAVACTDARVVVRPDPDGHFSCDLGVHGVSPWSPEEPNLYDVTVSLNRQDEHLDTRKYACGFRAIEMRGGRVHLNGSPLTLKGVCYVYDSPATGLVMAEEQVATDVALIKELGCNAVRCHYPMDERFYAACDRAGLLVWVEPNVYCYSPANDESGTMFARAESRAVAETMVVEMIATARNHPSVAIYGIGNECNTAHPEAAPFFRRLAALVREHAPAHLVSYAALYGNVGPLADMVDVLGINSYWGWYDRIWGGKGLEPDANAAPEAIDLAPMRRMLDEVLEKDQGLALLLTEFGADSVPGQHSPRRALWSEEYHADLLREIFALAAAYPQIAGTFPFCFSDYRDPSKIHNGYWNELNLKGLVTYARDKKAAFAAVQELYAAVETWPGTPPRVE